MELPRDNNSEQEINARLSTTCQISLPTKIYIHLPVNFSTLTGWRYPHLPRLKGHPLLGRIPYVLKDDGMLNNLIAAGKLAEQHRSGLCYYWLGHKLVLLITKPEHIHQLLIDHNKDATRGSSFRIFQTFMGSNITVDQAEKWKAKQEVYSEWIARASTLANHEQKMLQVVHKYLSYIEKNENKELNLKNVFNKYTLEILLNTVFLPEGYPPECVEKLLDYHKYVTKEIFEYKNIFKWLLPNFLRRIVYREPKRKVVEVCKHLRSYLNDIFLKPHELQLKKNDNFVKSIYNLTAHEKDIDLISDPNVFGDTSMMFLAGQDNNLATLEFFVKLLCRNPDCEEKLRNDLNNHLKGKEFNLENVNKVEYLDQTLKETLRMYPPVAFIPRDITNPFNLGGTPLAKGDTVVFSPFITHHLESIWEQHNVFNPERFDKKNKIPHQFYLPFGAGNHMCIGQRMAWQEIKLFLAAIYLKYKIKITDNNFELSLAQGSLKPKVTPLARFTPINA